MDIRIRSYGTYSNDNYGVHALVVTSKNISVYYSYRTPVAISTPQRGLVVCKNIWGSTTGKHLNWIDGGDKKTRVDSDEFVRILEEVFGTKDGSVL